MELRGGSYGDEERRGRWGVVKGRRRAGGHEEGRKDRRRSYGDEEGRGR